MSPFQDARYGGSVFSKVHVHINPIYNVELAT
jgi:hypothetical protein